MSPLLHHWASPATRRFPRPSPTTWFLAHVSKAVLSWQKKFLVYQAWFEHAFSWTQIKCLNQTGPLVDIGANDGTRIRNNRLGRTVLYQLNYVRIWRGWRDLNSRPLAWQASALLFWATSPWSCWSDSNGRGQLRLRVTNPVQSTTMRQQHLEDW